MSWAAAICESWSSWLSWLEGPVGQSPDSLAGGVEAWSAEAVMTVSWEQVLWEERSSPSEGWRCRGGGSWAEATAARARDADALERALAAADGGAPEEAVAVGKWEAREGGASAGGCTAQSPPAGARASVIVSVVVVVVVMLGAGPASSGRVDAGGATRRGEEGIVGAKSCK